MIQQIDRLGTADTQLPFPVSPQILGTATRPARVSCFPTAVDVVMGHPVATPPDASACETGDSR
jgi:hypothetical protein